MSRAALYRLEKNERPNASAVQVAKVAEALGTSVDYLLGLTNELRAYEQGITAGSDGLRLKMEQVTENLGRLPEDLQQDLASLLISQSEAALELYERGADDRST